MVSFWVLIVAQRKVTGRQELLVRSCSEVVDQQKLTEGLCKRHSADCGQGRVHVDFVLVFDEI